MSNYRTNSTPLLVLGDGPIWDVRPVADTPHTRSGQQRKFQLATPMCDA
ncbi:MAG: hypothetical protein H7319_19025 [Spirosoma sp.]|nr:hypothetical protein [Spirosoma sp.]